MLREEVRLLSHGEHGSIVFTEDDTLMKRASGGIILGLSVMIALLPVLQLGFTYYFSAQSIAVLVLCAILFQYPAKAELTPTTAIALGILMAAPLAWILGS